MGENFINLTRIAWLVGIALLVMVANIAASILYMVIYSYLIDPGHEKEHYDAHVQVAAPYCSIVAGIPLMFLAGWWVGGWWQGEFAIKSALVVWITYAIIDVAILMAAGVTSRMAVLVAVSLLTKLASVYFGTLFANGSRGA
jgi:ABC-type transport system involved in cytochrome c biogenesis permease subunit